MSMTNLDFRALCAELVELSAPTDSIPQLAERLQKLSELASRARTALAQPKPVAPTDEEIYKLALDRDFLVDVGDGFSCMVQDEVEFARAVLARWGTPANTINQEDYEG
jgi:hypothetical protein